MRTIRLLHSKTKKLIENRINKKYENFEFKFQNLESRFKNAEFAIINAIERYFQRDTRIDRVKAFNEGIKDIFESYREKIYILPIL